MVVRRTVQLDGDALLDERQIEVGSSRLERHGMLPNAMSEPVIVREPNITSKASANISTALKS